MTEPHFHEEHVHEEHVERKVVRPVRRTAVFASRSGAPSGTSVAALLLAALLAVAVIVLVFGYLL